MAVYQVVSKATGNVVDTYHADGPIEWSGMEFATHDHVAVVEFTQQGDIVGTASRVYDPVEFLRRFSPEERKSIWASQSLNADLDDGIKLLMKATAIHNDDPDVIRIVTMLESAGLLVTGRASEILNGQ